jgi:inorganic phosphate transporter, PiT family
MNLLFPRGLSLAQLRQYQLEHSWGGWRIVKTMAFRITELKPYQGFCAETGGGVILTAMAGLGIPVSTTQAISGAIMGVGSTRRLSAVRWGIGKRIVYAWLITIPASAAIASIVIIIIQVTLR